MERQVKLICENIQDTETEVLSDHQGTLCLVRFIHFPKEPAFFPFRFHYFHLSCFFVLPIFFCVFCCSFSTFLGWALHSFLDCLVKRVFEATSIILSVEL